MNLSFFIHISTEVFYWQLQF